MEKKKVFVYLFMVGVFALALFMLFRSNTPSFRGLSASVSPEEEKNIIMEAAKKYINHNIGGYNGEYEITIQDLIDNSYLAGDEINVVTNDLYDVNTRVYFKVKNNSIQDIYMKSEMFKKLFKCDNICYLEDNNYMYYNNEAYKILKVDSNGSVYIMSPNAEKTNYSNITSVISNKKNNASKNLVNNISILSKNDIDSSKLIEIENNTFIENNDEYKMYDITKKDLVDANENTSADVIYVIKLADTINYELGDGSKFNPYVVSE